MSAAAVVTSVPRTAIAVRSPDIARASLQISFTWYTYVYTVPFLCLYPAFAYAYYVRR